MGEKVDASKTSRVEKNMGRMVGRVEDVGATGSNESLVWPRRIECQGA